MAARGEEALTGQRTGTTGTGQVKPVPSTVTVQTAGPGSVLDQKTTYREEVLPEEALPGQTTGTTGTGQRSSRKPVPSTVTVQTAGPGSVLKQKPAYSQKPSQPSLTGQMQPRTFVPGQMTVQTQFAGQMPGHTS